MIDTNLIFVILIVFSFFIGLIIGRLYSLSGVSTNYSQKPKSFLRQENIVQSVEIDDKIYVTDIKTDGMVKKYNDLGEIKQSSDNISSSVDKLKQMKK